MAGYDTSLRLGFTFREATFAIFTRNKCVQLELVHPRVVFSTLKKII